MKIADNIKCKDFTIVARPSGSRLKGNENLWFYHVYYNGKEIDQQYMATTKKEARAFISDKVRKVNAVLNKARKLQAEGKLDEAIRKERI